MRSFLLLSLFLPVLCLTIPTQSQTGQDCPSISVSGPASIVAPGDIATYSVRVGNKVNTANLKYRWSVSSGEIVSGQDTTAIQLRQPDKAVTATVEVEGLPKGCPNRVSETTFIDPQPQAVELARFYFPFSSKDKLLLKKVVMSFHDTPNDSFWVFMRYSSTKKARIILSQMRKQFNQSIIFRDGNGPRITFLDVKDAKNYLQIWRVPAGAEAPVP